MGSALAASDSSSENSACLAGKHLGGIKMSEKQANDNGSADGEKVDEKMIHNDCDDNLNQAQLDRLSREKVEELQNQINSENCVTGPKRIEVLFEYFLGNESYLKKINDIIEKYNIKQYISVRRDGNCFYRCMSFYLLQMVVDNLLDAAELKIIFKEPIENLYTRGYEPIAFEEFLDIVNEGIDSLAREPTLEKVISILNENYLSDSIVVVLRYIISNEMLKNEDQYLCFLIDHASIKSFVQTEVEAMNREADHLQLNALAAALNLKFNVIHLDASTNEISRIEFGCSTVSSKPLNYTKDFNLLFVPGHYEIIF